MLVTARRRSFPPRPTHLECEPLLRILFADLATTEQLQAAVDQIRADGEAILATGKTVGAEYVAGTAPFQDQVHARAFIFDFLSNHARMLLEWADRTEAELARWTDLSADERAARAVQSIRDELSLVSVAAASAGREERSTGRHRPPKGVASRLPAGRYSPLPVAPAGKTLPARRRPSEPL